MNFQIHISCLLIIAIVFFQPTDQHRLSKRELTEYDLTSFIVGTCSSDKNDVLIRTLCDQTLESALAGNFPFLIYYCKTLGAGMNYCHNLNRQTIVEENNGAKRLAYRRLVRSLHRENKLHRKESVMKRQADLSEKLIVSKCILSSEEILTDNDQFCNETLQAIQQGQYPIIRHICMYYPSTNNYCQIVRSYSAVDSPLSSLTPTHMQSNNPLSFESSSSSSPSPSVKSIDIESTINQ